MKLSFLVALFRKIEPLIAIFLLLVSVNLDVPPFLDSSLRLARYGLIALLFFGICIGRWQQIAYVMTRDLFPWLLILLGLFSISWSAASERTLDEMLPLIRDTIFGTYLAARYTPKKLMYLVATTLGIGALLSFFFIVAVPSYGTYFTDGDGSKALSGIYGHKQYFGLYMSMGAMTLLNAILGDRKHRLLWLVCLCLTTLLIIFSYSKTSLLLLLIAIALLPLYRLLLSRRQYRRRVIITISILFLIITIFTLIISNLETIVVDTLGKNLEFNGRVPLWNLGIQKGLERPWLGYGYAGFWHSDNGAFIVNNSWLEYMENDPRSFHFHNDFVEIFVQLGFAGLVGLFLSFISLLLRTIYLINITQKREFFWILQFIILAFLAAISGYKILLHRDFIWSLYVSMCFYTALECGRIKKKQRQSLTNKNFTTSSI